MHYYGDINDYISHHGILGQRWGKKNGPPYPLGSGDHSASEKKAGWRKSLNDMKLSIYKGRKRVLENKIEETEKEIEMNSSGLKRKTENTSPDEDAVIVNPEWRRRIHDPGANNNCMQCTTAYELRRRGYDVRAQLSSEGRGADAIKEWFPEAKIEGAYIPERGSFGMTRSTMRGVIGRNSELTDTTINTLVAQGDGARGNLLVTYDSHAGHSLCYEVVGRDVVIRDAQTGKKFDTPEAVLNWCATAQYARLDNLSFDKEKIKEAVK